MILQTNPCSTHHIIKKSITFAGSVPFSVSAAISSKPVNFGYRCKAS